MAEISHMEMYNELVITTDWIKSLKINLDDTIIPEVLKYTYYYADEYPKYKNGEIDDFKYSEETGHARDFASTINLIRKSFEGREFKKLKTNLKIAISNTAPLISSEENNLDNSTQARNMLYELESAAYMISENYNVTDELDDINYWIGKKKVNIQNKRLLTFNKLEESFYFAIEQLINRNNIINDPNSYGFVAFSLEKIYGMDKGILPIENKVELFSDMDKLRNDMNDRTDPFLMETFKKYGKDFRLIGRMYLYKRPVFNRERNIFTYYRTFLYEIIKDTPHTDIVNYLTSKVPVNNNFMK